MVDGEDHRSMECGWVVGGKVAIEVSCSFKRLWGFHADGAHALVYFAKGRRAEMDGGRIEGEEEHNINKMTSGQPEMFFSINSSDYSSK